MEQPANVAATDNAYPLTQPVNIQLAQSSVNVLHHRVGVASGRAGISNAFFAQKLFVEVIYANRTSTNETHPGGTQQTAINVGNSTHQERVGIVNIFRRELATRTAHYFSQMAKKGLNQGNIFISNNFYLGVFHRCSHFIGVSCGWSADKAAGHRTAVRRQSVFFWHERLCFIGLPYTLYGDGL